MLEVVAVGLELEHIEAIFAAVKAIVATAMEVQMDGSPLAVTSVEVPMNESLHVATAAKMWKILSIEPITAMDVPIVTTRP